MDDTSSIGGLTMDDGSMFTSATLPHDILPQLPGYRANHQTQNRKKCALKYAEEMAYVEDEKLGSTRQLLESSSATSLVLGAGKPLYSMGSPKKQGKNGARPVVLSFKAYFKEAVHESPLENHRIRKVEIFYYMEDNSIQIVERKQENSGVPQGNFMGRHQVPKDADTFFGLADLVIGSTISLYGRTYHIIDANPSTLSYLDKLAEDDATINTSGDRTEFPTDKFEVDRAAKMSRETGKDPSVKHNIRKNPNTIFAEAALGNTVDNKGREGFLKYDRKVLRFTCFWDDRESLYGDMQQFKLHYFLTDDTVECLQVYGQNCGRDPYPLLVKRRKMPKDLKDEGSGDLHWSDIQIGGPIQVYARTLIVYSVDDSTRSFYEEQGVPLAPSLTPPAEKQPVFERNTPPYTGFGTEADSLTSCVGSLVQTAPKKVLGEDRTLRYMGRLDSDVAEDIGREFVLQYFLVDSTLAIREPFRRNSGIVGGNFFRRGQDPVRTNGGVYLEAKDFYIGSKIAVAGFVFVITDSDDATLKYMERKESVFPYSSYALVMNSWGSTMQGALDDDSIYKACAEAGEDGGYLTMDGLKSLLTMYNCTFVDQELITVVRKLGTQIEIDTFVAQLKSPDMI
mmetsp:Transcript_93153/g.266146  ORF Transcript_93153/g.266146 Transcript_93153/m.266146 type:complete len:623 (+) Transcript_93153:66-1934(+)